jgi:hypothetical protein
MHPMVDNEFVEVFRAESEFAARRVADVILVPEGINAVIHDRVDTMFPGLGQPGGWFVAVPGRQRNDAVRLIRAAQGGGMLDENDGATLPPKP